MGAERRIRCDLCGGPEPTEGDVTDEGEADWYRRHLRSIRHLCNLRNPHIQDLERISDLADKALRRPRSNGLAADALERAQGDLESARIDVKVARMQLREAEHQITALTEQLTRVPPSTGILGRFEAFIGRLERAYQSRKGRGE